MNKLAYIIVVVAFLIDKTIQALFITPIWFSSYFDDFLLIPIFLGSALLVQHVLVNPLFTFSTETVIAVWLLCSVIFELVFPFVLTGFTRDYCDIIAYGLGAICYNYFLNYPAVNSKV